MLLAALHIGINDSVYLLSLGDLIKYGIPLENHVSELPVCMYCVAK